MWLIPEGLVILRRVLGTLTTFRPTLHRGKPVELADDTHHLLLSWHSALNSSYLTFELCAALFWIIGNLVSNRYVPRTEVVLIDAFLMAIVEPRSDLSSGKLHSLVRDLARDKPPALAV